MADSNEGLRIGKASLGAVATVLIAVAGITASYAGELSNRIGSLERQVSSIESRHDAEQDATQCELAEIKSIVEKIRDRLDGI